MNATITQEIYEDVYENLMFAIDDAANRKKSLSCENVCEVCGGTYNVNRHHIFGGCRKQTSDKYGLTIFLCDDHHENHKTGVHHDPVLMDTIHVYGQELFSYKYPDLDFFQIFGKNYIY